MNLTEFWNQPAEERIQTRVDLEPGEYQTDEWQGSTPNQRRTIHVKDENGGLLQYPYVQLEGNPQLFSTDTNHPTILSQPSLFWIL